jgi:hypothetical protein
MVRLFEKYTSSKINLFEFYKTKVSSITDGGMKAVNFGELEIS